MEFASPGRRPICVRRRSYALKVAIPTEFRQVSQRMTLLRILVRACFPNGAPELERTAMFLYVFIDSSYELNIPDFVFSLFLCLSQVADRVKKG